MNNEKDVTERSQNYEFGGTSLLIVVRYCVIEPQPLVKANTVQLLIKRPEDKGTARLLVEGNFQTQKALN